MNRQLTVAGAILEATDQCMAMDPNVYVIGLGATDPKGIFGTTVGLPQKYPQRIFDMPVAENGMTGVTIGSALAGMRPIMTHQRLDFALMSVEQIINNAAKWRYMFGGNGGRVPLTVRMIIGQGWGQGPQHSQTLQALFMHVPGLKVVMPFSPYDVKGLLIASVQDDNPVIFIEHRWLYNIQGMVPKEMYTIPIGKAKTIREGHDVSLVSVSSMLLECLKAEKVLRRQGISAEIIDLQTIKPLDREHILDSVRKTGRLIAVDSGYLTGGLAAEVCATVSEMAFRSLRSPVCRLTAPDCPAPTTRALIKDYYPTAQKIVAAAWRMLDRSGECPTVEASPPHNLHSDVPDLSFTGPF